jgi:hypothetical protein
MERISSSPALTDDRIISNMVVYFKKSNPLNPP